MSRLKLQAQDLALPHPQHDEHQVKRGAVYALLIEEEYLKEEKPYMQNISMSKNSLTSCTRIAVDHRMATNKSTATSKKGSRQASIKAPAWTPRSKRSRSKVHSRS